MKTLVGYIGVDSGLCWIGDPCYILHKKKEFPTEVLGKNWKDFCDRLSSYEIDNGFSPLVQTFPYKKGGGDGLGCVVSTGYGDGSYKVFANIVNNRVQKVWVEFFSNEGDDDE